jgi:hypothetical protein
VEAEMAKHKIPAMELKVGDSVTVTRQGTVLKVDPTYPEIPYLVGFDAAPDGYWRFEDQVAKRNQPD